MTNQVVSQVTVEREHRTTLRKVMVAQDFSKAADRALEDAMALSERFHSEIVITHVNSLYANLFEVSNSQPWHDPVRIAMENLTRRVALAGHRCKEVIRVGDVAKTLGEIAREECADILLLGAYGDGPKDRVTLGHTAELLLRSASCPMLTYGPKVTQSLFHARNRMMSVLVPIELPCDLRYLFFAASIAKLFNAKLELLHVVDMERAVSMPHAFQDVQYICEEIATSLREQGVTVSGSLLFGKPDEAIISRCKELQSSFILIPLETREHLSSATSDNVAAKVIRGAEVPVMTYRID